MELHLPNSPPDNVFKMPCKGYSWAILVSVSMFPDFLPNSDFRGICNGGYERLACSDSASGCCVYANLMFVLGRYMGGEGLGWWITRA